jgi:Fur family transcriptional regulator, ferric uptake regulator
MSGRREDVRRALAGNEAFRSAQDIYTDLRSTGSKIGLTTVYRALQTLTDAGDIDVLRNDDGEAIYRACHTGEHHHHLVCRVCGTTVEVAGPDVERWAESVGADHGFTGVTHTVEVFGTCTGCLNAAHAAAE